MATGVPKMGNKGTEILILLPFGAARQVLRWLELLRQLCPVMSRLVLLS